MNKSENQDDVKALKAALKRAQKMNAKLEAKHKSDKEELKKLRRKASEGMATKGPSSKKKEQALKKMQSIKLSDQQKEKLEELFPGITTMNFPSD